MDDWYVAHDTTHNCEPLKHQFTSLFNLSFFAQHFTSPSVVEQQHKSKQGNSCRFESGSLKDFNISSTTSRLAPGFVDANHNEVCTLSESTQ